MRQKIYEAEKSGDQIEVRSNGKHKRKQATGILAAILALLLLMSGTFAWYYVTNAVNEFGGKRYPDSDSSAVLHDDFEEAGRTQENGSVVHNKDVYVENTGDHPIYVRIRLDEYMEISGESVIKNADKMDESTWRRHIPKTDEAEECEEVFHDYWVWQMAGSTKYVANAAGKNGVVSRYAANGTDTLPASGTKDTLTAEVITMAEYLKKDDTKKAEYIGWIYDTDGYAYWSQQLESQSATGLLLDQVTLKQEFPRGTVYYYAINVVMETVDDDDLGAWLNGTETSNGKKPEKASTNAADFLKRLSADETDEMKAELNSKDVGDVVTLSGIDWIIINKEADSVEVLSKDIIAESVFVESGTYKWEGSTVRGYLNGEFKDSLSPELQAMIKTVKKETEKSHDDNAKVETSETIYLLSKEEAENLGASYLKCACVDGISRSVYWLRSPGKDVNTVYRVNRTTGDVASSSGDTTVNTVRGVRPAMTIDLQ